MTTRSVQICSNQSITIGSQIVTEAGIFFDTLTSIITGCDSIDQVTVTVVDTFMSMVTFDGCSGDDFEVIVNGTMYNESNPSGSETLTAVNGCDSVVTIDLNFRALPPNPVIEPITLCFGDGTSTEIIPSLPPGDMPDDFIVSWEFEGNLTPTSNNTNATGIGATIGGTLTQGFNSGVAGNDLNLSRWDPGDYIEFCITATGENLSITEIFFYQRASGTGPQNFELFTDTDLFASPVLTGATTSTHTRVSTPISRNLTDGTQGCYRLIGINNSGIGNMRIDSFSIVGQTAPAMPSTTFNFFSDASGTPIAGAQGVTSFDPGVTLSGIHEFYVATIDDGCSSDTVMTTITILAIDTTGLTRSICQGDSTLFDGAYISTAGTFFETATDNTTGCLLYTSPSPRDS